MLTPEQKFRRLDGIGASEIPAILGLDRYAKASDVLAVKTGQAPEFEGNQYTEWGNLLEPVIADWYVSKYGGVAHRSDAIWHPTIPFVFCTPDRIIVRDGETHGLEIKNKGYSQKTHWKDGVPEKEEAQCRWSMLATGFERWDLAVLINGNDARAYTLTRDRDWEGQALKVATRFWKRVQKVNRELWGAT